MYKTKIDLSRVIKTATVDDHVTQGDNYSDVIMGVMASQITCVSIVSCTVCSGADQRKHQSSKSMAFVRGIHRSPMDSPHKGSITRKFFPFHDVIMKVWMAMVLTFLSRDIPDSATEELLQRYNDFIMSAMASQITSLMTVYSTVYSRRWSKKHQSSASLAFVRGINRSPVNSPHLMTSSWRMCKYHL